MIGQGLDGIVVARVLQLRAHPNADRMQLVDVDMGDGDQLQICCGAFNMAVGDLVPLATIGTVMPSGMKISRSKKRGEWSNGMLCSPPELGLPGDDRGILILGNGLVPGTALRDALGLEPDVLYDLEINPNRPDAMSVAGVARDLAAHFKVAFALPSPDLSSIPSGDPVEGVVTVENLAPDLCGRFTARVLQGVRVGPSPQRIASRLTLLGMRPINNVVDVSNYVMLELGQPSHPYDLALVGGGGLRVRRAHDGESLVTLDGVERRFTGDDLLICDGNDAPNGIGGIMGGASIGDLRFDHRRARRDGVVPTDGHRQVVATAGRPQRGLRSIREGLRSRDHRPGAGAIHRASRPCRARSCDGDGRRHR